MTEALNTDVQWLQFEGLSGPVRFSDCGALIAAIRQTFAGWPIRAVSAKACPHPPMRVTRTRRGYRRVSTRLSTPSRSREKVRQHVVAALCGFHFELIDWFVEEHPELLFIHGAAARLPAGLVLFPAVAKAGKSTLSVALAMEGVRLFGDDVVPIERASRHAMALGIAPRLRPPLPATASDRLRAFVAANAGPTYRNRSYIDLGSELLAPLGETAPVAAVVLLDRGADGDPRLEAVDPADALEEIILQNFARDVPSPEVLDVLADVVGQAACMRLAYETTSQAAELLLERFAS